ncbi:hypothetical protein BH09PSE4_BH09PSE4_20990 [soil metagenome]
MKLLAFLAAGVIAATAVTPTVASAQTRVKVVTTTRHHQNVRHWDNRRHHGWRTVCRNVWRHHRRVRSCTKVRY